MQSILDGGTAELYLTINESPSVLHGGHIVSLPTKALTSGDPGNFLRWAFPHEPSIALPLQSPRKFSFSGRLIDVFATEASIKIVPRPDTELLSNVVFEVS